MGERFRDQAHLLRVVVLFLGGFFVFVLLKAVLVPKDFGVYGHYRAGALDDARVQPIAYAGQDACAACHDAAQEAVKGGKHGGVRCEACHGPLASHAEAEKPEAAKPRRPTARLCPVCHEASVTKPADFAQVQLKEHAEPGTCLECHQAHRPSM